MKNALLTVISIFVFTASFAQQKQIVETRDIDNFWSAYDKLEYANSKNDSTSIIQTEYINRSTDYFKEFIRLRHFSAEEYIKKIKEYPKFWSSVRKETEKVKSRKAEIEKVLDTYEKALPGFKRSNVCFTIGCLRTGGTVSNGVILIGTEIAAATTETDQSELSSWLKSVIGKTGDIVSMVAHETIHTQQVGGQLRNLAEFAISEGVADFLSEKITGSNINKVIYEYGTENDCALRKAFLNDFSKSKTDYSGWLFNGSKSINRPADLGYYIGYRIAQDYYLQATDKKEAMTFLLNTKNYMKIFRTSEYINKGCS